MQNAGDKEEPSYVYPISSANLSTVVAGVT
jgi:hypothetical protein